MLITSLKLNNMIEPPIFKREVKSYREAEGVITTENNIKPLPPKGYLVNDDFNSLVKYFFKDIEYDLKSLKNGYNGSANDHQLGRINNIGLLLGGTTIATYLASKTTNPKARVMEYVGFAMFLLSMSLYPKLVINYPAKLLHGYDIGKQYIDDQGRKKSVYQDSNYVPYDMYGGKDANNDIDIIGDKMGIPRGIHNRHDLIKEQMRKIATQNNTLWMLTAGFATPLIAALTCNILDNNVVSPIVSKTRNIKYNSVIKSMLEKTSSMQNDVSNIDNGLGKQVGKLVERYKDKEITPEIIEDIVNCMTHNTDSILADGIRRDVTQILSDYVYSINFNNTDSIINNAKLTLKGRSDIINKIIPDKIEFENIIKEVHYDSDFSKDIILSNDEVVKFKQKLSDFINKKISCVDDINQKDFLIRTKRDFIENIIFDEKIKVTDDSIKKLTDFAKIMGDFSENQIVLDKCKNFKFEYAPETILARYYEKFQNELYKGLKISYKDYEKIRDNKDFAEKLLNEKLESLCKDELKYEKLFKKLAGIMADMENDLHGNRPDASKILDLISSIENNYNKTALRLKNANIGKNTIGNLVKQDVYTLSNEVTSKSELLDILDGIKMNTASNMVIEANGKGSAKNREITRLISRYQGIENSFFRIMHSMELYKRSLNPDIFSQYTTVKNEEYINSVIDFGKKSLLGAATPDYINKFNTVNNPMSYKDLIHSVWAIEQDGFVSNTKQKGVVTDSARKALSEKEKEKSANLLERYQYYISRSKNILTNDATDFTKPYHRFWQNVTDFYTKYTKTNEAVYNLVGQNPVDMIQKGAARKHGNRKWFVIVSSMTGIVLGVTLLSQLAFGKITNKQNIKKADNDTL